MRSNPRPRSPGAIFLVVRNHGFEPFEAGTPSPRARGACSRRSFQSAPEIDGWNIKGPARSSRPKRRTVDKAHRVAWCIAHGGWPPEQIDHINGDRSDNRFPCPGHRTMAEVMADEAMQSATELSQVAPARVVSNSFHTGTNSQKARQDHG